MSSFLLWADRQKKHADGANGPAEAIGGRFETLRSMVLGFRSLDNYITRSLPHAGGIQASRSNLPLTTPARQNTKSPLSEIGIRSRVPIFPEPTQVVSGMRSLSCSA